MVLTRALLRHSPGTESPVSVILGHKPPQRDDAPIARTEEFRTGGSPGRRSAWRRDGYLEPVRDIRIDFVDQSDAIIEHGRRLAGL